MSPYAGCGLVLFFALGFGAGVRWATRCVASALIAPPPEPDVGRGIGPNTGESFWDDLNRRMGDPEFRTAFIEMSLRIQAIDAQANGGDGAP